MNKKKEENIPTKRAMNAFIKFIEVCESGETLLKNGAFYEKETLRYFSRLINALSNLQKYGDIYTKKQINEVKAEANRILDKEMKRIKYIHAEAKKEIKKF